jgi:hypothetical protein
MTLQTLSKSTIYAKILVKNAVFFLYMFEKDYRKNPMMEVECKTGKVYILVEAFIDGIQMKPLLDL